MLSKHDVAGRFVKCRDGAPAEHCPQLRFDGAAYLGDQHVIGAAALNESISCRR